jgi:hypothetical protein
VAWAVGDGWVGGPLLPPTCLMAPLGRRQANTLTATVKCAHPCPPPPACRPPQRASGC